MTRTRTYTLFFDPQSDAIKQLSAARTSRTAAAKNGGCAEIDRLRIAALRLWWAAGGNNHDEGQVAAEGAATIRMILAGESTDG